MRSPGTKCSSRWDGCIQERLGKNGYVRGFFSTFVLMQGILWTEIKLSDKLVCFSPLRLTVHVSFWNSGVKTKEHF